MATSQGNRIVLSIFRDDHAVIFNCFMLWLYSSGFGLHVSPKSLHYSNYTSLPGSPIKLLLSVSIPLLWLRALHTVFHAVEHLVQMTLSSLLHLLRQIFWIKKQNFIVSAPRHITHNVQSTPFSIWKIDARIFMVAVKKVKTCDLIHYFIYI